MDDEDEIKMQSPYSGSAVLEMFDPNAKKKNPRDMTALEIARLQIGQAPFDMRERQLARQMKFADELRGAALPQLRDAGRYKVAPAFTEQLNAGLSRGLGAIGRGNVERQENQLLKDRMASVDPSYDQAKIDAMAQQPGFLEWLKRGIGYGQ